MKNKYIKIGCLSISLLYIDLFCGAGGTSTGIETAQVKGEKCAKIIAEDDSPMMKKIKEFMALYGLKDIKMRMLTIQELKEIMGFPPDYVLIGSQADQKKFIGNAVEVTVARKICEATSKYFFDLRKVA